MNTQIWNGGGSHDLTLDTYWTGKDGACLQLSGKNVDHGWGRIGMTLEEAAELERTLSRWLAGELVGPGIHD